MCHWWTTCPIHVDEIDFSVAVHGGEKGITVLAKVRVIGPKAGAVAAHLNGVNIGHGQSLCVVCRGVPASLGLRRSQGGRLKLLQYLLRLLFHVAAHL